MKIIILGSNGQLGNELKIYFKNKHSIKSFNKESLDIGNFSLVEDMIKGEKPNIIINAAAYTSVDKAEYNAEKAFYINSKAVKNIALNLESIKGYLIHFSTDYVFDGLKNEPYSENDKPSPINIYGESKLEGEINIQENMGNYFIIRTSWVIGTYGNNFAKTIFRLIKEKENLNVVNDQFGVPTSTTLISNITEMIISNIKNSNHLMPGIYNLSPKGKTTWYQIAKNILSKLIKEKLIQNSPQIKINPIETVNYHSAAKRPRNSLLNSEKIEKNLNFELPYWEEDFNNTLDKILIK